MSPHYPLVKPLYKQPPSSPLPTKIIKQSHNNHHTLLITFSNQQPKKTHKMQYQAAPTTESWITPTTQYYYNYNYLPLTHKHYPIVVANDPLEKVAKLVSQSAVVIFSLSTCCMCYAVKSLFSSMGVNPTVYELDEDPIRGKEIEKALVRLMGSSMSVPVVFIGGKLVGSMDRVMGSHINGTLVPLLKKAGALWL